MREALFVKQNAEKWNKYEASESKNPDEIAGFFIDITDDLAYSKTFYPQSKTTAYLNGIASKFHLAIYRNKKEKNSQFKMYWKFELPLLFAIYRRQLFYSFLFFMIFCLMGALSAKYDDSFIRLILGDHYVNMTNENIARGDPFEVYKDKDQFLMFFMIATNNIFVSIYTFVSGIFFSIGTVINLVRNGIMVGAFQYYFFSKGLGMASVLVIWIHGTLEISAIIIAGGAGLILGNSMLFPKTYKRLDSIKKGAKGGMKIVIGLIPIFVCAAFLEGCVTRHTEMPVWLSLGILIGSLSFIIWYVIIYPGTLLKTLKTPKTYNGTKN